MVHSGGRPEARTRPTLEALGIDRTTVGERIALVHLILDPIAADQPRPPLSEAKKAELARRMADADANPDEVVSWDEVEAAALARFRRSAVISLPGADHVPHVPRPGRLAGPSATPGGR